MPQFYARYIPSTPTKAIPSPQPSADLKRKNASKPAHDQKRRKLDVSNNEPSKAVDVTVTGQNERPVVGADQSATATPSNTLEKKRSKNKTQKQSRANGTSVSDHDQSDLKDQGRDTLGENGENDEDEQRAKHAKVLTRFTKYKENASQWQEQPLKQATQDSSTNGNVHPDRAAIVHDLRPIPQPDIHVPVRTTPSYATAPEWLRQPIVANQHMQRGFDELGLPETVLKSLVAQGKGTSLPVQAAVLPLLVGKEIHKRPDLCVAAATGSGKTFAYILPILSSLSGRSRRRLRAVIVVPTRALVKQVVHAIESCSAGLDVQIGTAEGSKTLAEEQRQLVDETWVYDTQECQRQRDSAIDWSTFSLDNLLEEAARQVPPPIGYIQAYLSKVDILVCTPGRLVEHLQTTKGFNLDDVHWFVADEADRLLNESYHEWLDIVLPALKSQKATEKRDNILRHMHLDVPVRRVTKVLLSATMTKDISQLLGLELTEPKLVIVDQPQTPSIDEPQVTGVTDTTAEYSMPPRLTESAIALKDTENKPLYLLELLNNYVFAKANSSRHDPSSRSNQNMRQDNDSTSSSSSKDSSSTDNDTSSSDSSSERDGTSDASSISSMTSSSTSSRSRTNSPIPSQQKGTPIGKTPIALPRALIFTRSTESAHRLSRLLTILSPSLASSIATFTRSSTANDSSSKSSKSLSRTRNRILQSFTKGTTRILISTDVAARGLDIPNLEHVINYDMPASALTYVHRVGRTARAGMEGQAWTLVEHRQGKWFWETIGGKATKDGEKSVIGRGDRTVQKVNLSIDKEKWKTRYEEALQKLGEDVRGQS